MTIAYKALAALLSYPAPELIEALREIDEALQREPALGRRQRKALSALIDELAGSDSLDAQERYVALFDRGRSTSLHLFEHVHGESRGRGPAMVDLNAVYARAGLVLKGNELPDYLPALLEFLSLQPREVAAEMLGDCAHILRRVRDALDKRGSRYAAVFGAVLELAGQPARGSEPDAGETASEGTLDDEWAEEPVTFGPAAASSCGASASGSAVVRFVPREGARR